MRAIEATMQYHLPLTLSIYLLKAANRMMNMVPSVRTGTMSPYTIINERRPEASLYDLAFGETVLVTDPTPHTATNNRDNRANLAIFLGHSDTSSTSGVYLVLATRTVKSRSLVSAKPAVYGEHVLELLKPLYEGVPFDQHVRAADRILTTADRATYINGARKANSKSAVVPGEFIVAVNKGDDVPGKSAAAVDKGADVPGDSVAVVDKGTIIPDEPVATADKGANVTDVSVAADDTGAKFLNEPTATEGTNRRVSFSDEAVVEVDKGETLELHKGGDQQFTPTPEDPGIRSRYGRSYRVPAKMAAFAVIALLSTLARDLNKFGQAGELSAFKEVRQILDTGSVKPVNPTEVSYEEKRQALDCKLFIEAKRDGRIKSRFVGGTGASSQDRSTFPDLSSPTVRFESVALLLKSAAQKGHKIAVADIPGAYLHAQFHDLSLNPTPGNRRFIRAKGMLADMMGNIDQKCKQSIDDNGVLYLQLHKALYGLIESAKLWYAELSNMLLAAEFTQYTSDPCIFYHQAKQVTIGVYVDDLIILYDTNEFLDWFLQLLEDKYGEPRVQRNTSVDYLNVSITRLNSSTNQFPEGTFLVSQQGYLETLKNKYPDYFWTDDSVKVPYTTELFSDGDVSPASDPKMFVSVVMSLVYVCTRARPDIFLAISYLCTKVKNPTAEDETKLRRLCAYLQNTITLVLAFTPSTDLNIVSWVDASYAIHDDAKGHSGTLITVGCVKGSPVFIRSRKQKLVTRSSTESELVAMHDASPQVVWTKGFLEELGHAQRPAVIMQDNKSTIFMAEKGSGNFHRTKHIAVRYFAIKQLIEEETVQLQYSPTETMLADPLTKPVIGKRFVEWRDQILFSPQ